MEDATEEYEDESDCYEIEVSNSCFAVFSCRVCHLDFVGLDELLHADLSFPVVI